MNNVHAIVPMTNEQEFSSVHSYLMPEAKSLQQYQQEARLPDLDGIAARVLLALERRIGHSSLAIAHLASDLNLSKRTLQRRLQQEDINFAQLRDKLRFNHAITYLVEQKISIDSISSSLDFSDRTSFTNAFKRWTDLSPSLFRKLYRDYV